MKYNTKYGVIWFAIMLPINTIVGIVGTLIGLLLLLTLDSNFLYFLPLGLFCLANIRVYFELSQNLTPQELKDIEKE